MKKLGKKILTAENIGFTMYVMANVVRHIEQTEKIGYGCELWKQTASNQYTGP